MLHKIEDIEVLIIVRQSGTDVFLHRIFFIHRLDGNVYGFLYLHKQFLVIDHPCEQFRSIQIFEHFSSLYHFCLGCLWLFHRAESKVYVLKGFTLGSWYISLLLVRIFCRYILYSTILESFIQVFVRNLSRGFCLLLCFLKSYIFLSVLSSSLFSFKGGL